MVDVLARRRATRKPYVVAILTSSAAGSGRSSGACVLVLVSAVMSFLHLRFNSRILSQASTPPSFLLVVIVVVALYHVVEDGHKDALKCPLL